MPQRKTTPGTRAQASTPRPARRAPRAAPTIRAEAPATPEFAPYTPVAETLLALQKTHGNAAVQRMIERRTLTRPRRSAPSLPAPGGSARNVQRQPPATQATGRWNAPFEFGTASTAEEAWNLVAAVWMKLANLRQDLERAEETDTAAELEMLVDEAIDWTRHFRSEEGAGRGGDPLPASRAGDLNEFGRDAERAYNSGMGVLRRRAQAALAPIADASPPDTSATEAELAEALHFAFIEGSESQVESIKEAVDKLKDYKDKVSDVLTWARRASSLAGAARTMDQLDRALGGLERAGGVIDKVSDVLSAARALGTLSGLDNQAISEAHNDIQRFEAGLDAIDLAMGFFKAVPLIGTLWSSYYSPLTRQCLRLLGIIARHRDLEGRQYGVLEFWQQQMQGRRGAGGAPVIPDYLRQYFPGGQPVLNFMYALMRDRQPTAGAAVQNFFLQHRDLFNAGQESGNELEAEGGSSWYAPWTWGDEETLANLTTWVTRNKQQVWSMLYGSLQPNI
jgi:hypothetical protein